MTIAGLQKMTLLDYPGKVACTVFLSGCNFRCPFCHNGELVCGEVPEAISEEALLSFLKQRRALLDGVCITGGEPTIYADLPELLQRIKALGYPVKLDTNGYRPEMLKALLDAHLVDYVAMDIKNCPARYAETVGLPEVDLGKIRQSIALLLNSGLPFEFRTTVSDELHSEDDILHMGQWLAQQAQNMPIRALYLQPYTERDTVLRPGLHTPDVEKLHRFREILQPFAEAVQIRGAE